MEFHQKKYLKRKTFLVGDNELIIELSGGSTNTKYSIPFEEVGLQKVYKSVPIYVKYILFAIWFIIIVSAFYANFFIPGSMKPNTFWVIFVLYSFITFFLYFPMNKRNVYLVGPQGSIEFFADRPSKEEVETFLDSLILKVKAYLKNKYLIFDMNVPEDILMRTAYSLKNAGVVTQSEYDDFVTEYKNRKLL